MDKDSIFSKIIAREIPSTIRYEDDEFIVIDDIHPVAPVHLLVIPKEPYETLEQVEVSDGHFHKRLLQIARFVAKEMGIADNYKIFMNVGKKVQEIHHVHLHVYGGWDKKKKASEIVSESKNLIHTEPSE